MLGLHAGATSVQADAICNDECRIKTDPELAEGQDKIYYITADSFLAAKNSPQLELLRKKGIEVLLLSDRVDEWLTSHLPEFEGKALASVAKGALDPGAITTKKLTLVAIRIPFLRCDASMLFINRSPVVECRNATP